MKKMFAPFLTLIAGLFIGVAEKMHQMLFAHMANQGMVLGMSSVMSPSDFDARRVTNPDQSEVFRNSLYDFQLYATAGVAQMTFFAQPVGAGLTSAPGGVVGTAKTFADTNMQMPSTLSSGLAFNIESIEVPFFPGSVATANTYTMAAVSVFGAASSAALQGFLNDTNSFYQSGYLELNVLAKNYLREAPLIKFPPKTNFQLSAATASTSATQGATSMATMQAAGRPYYIEPTITLQPAMNFEVLLKFPAAVATPSGFNARVGVNMDGKFMRASQ